MLLRNRLRRSILPCLWIALSALLMAPGAVFSAESLSSEEKQTLKELLLKKGIILEVKVLVILMSLELVVWM